jgi:hypothetical protein
MLSGENEAHYKFESRVNDKSLITLNLDACLSNGYIQAEVLVLAVRGLEI